MGTDNAGKQAQQRNRATTDTVLLKEEAVKDLWFCDGWTQKKIGLLLGHDQSYISKLANARPYLKRHGHA